MHRIESPDDPRVSAYTRIRERDLVTKNARFIVEGERVLELALARGRFALDSVLLGENRVDPMRALLATLTERGIPVYVASQAVLDAISGFHIHRGVLAVGLRGNAASAEALLRDAPARAFVVCVCGVQNHDNVGGIFRNAAAFGAHAVIVDGATCDPLYRKAIRVSVGAALVVPFAEVDTDMVLLDLLAREGFTPYAMSPRAEEDLARVSFAGRSALVLGSEEPGLSREVMERATPLAIAMSGLIDSLNVATASGIAMHALSVARR